MAQAIISTVLGTYNRLDFLKLAIKSIRQETEFVPHEIIVIDGGSTDGTLKWLCHQKDLITIIQHNRGTWQNKSIERRSWGYFMNLGFRAATGKYVCMLSDDCLLIPNSIKHGYLLFEKELKNERNIGAVAFYFRDWSVNNKYFVGIPFNKMFVNHGMYSKKALEAVNYIDEENYFFYGADVDLCFKMWNKGYVCIDSPNSFVEHYPHANKKIRKSNHFKDELELKPVIAKWKTIFPETTYLDPNSTLTTDFLDQSATGKKFNKLHFKETILKQNPLKVFFVILRKTKKYLSKYIKLFFVRKN